MLGSTPHVRQLCLSAYSPGDTRIPITKIVIFGACRHTVRPLVSLFATIPNDHALADNDLVPDTVIHIA